MSERDGVEGDPPRSCTKRAPFRKPDPKQKVGPGSPPAEYKWPKGFCPNIAGRPRKKVVEMNLPVSVNPLQRKAIAHANKVVGEVNGEPITRFERLLMALEVSAPENPAIAKALLDLFGQANRDKEQTDILVLRAVFEYKDKWAPVFARAKVAGRAPPPVYPHPDDLIIYPDGSVKIDGPMTAEEAKALDAAIKYRDALFFVAEEGMDWVDNLSVEERHRKWQSLRRKFYRIHRRIPRRLYIPFPPFRATPRDEQTNEERLGSAGRAKKA